MAKDLTVREMAAMGGKARAEKYGNRQIRTWGKMGGRPVKVGDLAHLRRLLAKGNSQTECAETLSVSLRTIGRAVARMKAKP